MKSWFVNGILAAMMALPALGGLAPAYADKDNFKCSNATLKGDYGFKGHGKLLGIVTAAGPQIFADPILVDSVAMVFFDGKGKFSQVDYVLRDGVPFPGLKDPEDRFQSSATRRVHRVCRIALGNSRSNPLPAALVESKFVLAEQGRQLFRVVSRQRDRPGDPGRGQSSVIFRPAARPS